MNDNNRSTIKSSELDIRSVASSDSYIVSGNAFKTGNLIPKPLEQHVSGGLSLNINALLKCLKM